MARVTGLEPAASGVTGQRSNQLSYTRLNNVSVIKARLLTCPACKRQRVLRANMRFFQLGAWRGHKA